MRACLAFLALVPFATAAAPVQSVTIAASAGKAKAGKVPVTVVIGIPDGYHIYGPKGSKTGIATAIKVKGTTFKIDKVAYPKTKPFTQFGETSQVYEERVRIPLVLRATKKLSGKQKIQIQVTSQACNDRTCLPPDTRTVTITATMG